MERDGDKIIQIILLGDFCGKTSLLERYTKEFLMKIIILH